jgi:hypothetical protein
MQFFCSFPWRSDRNFCGKRVAEFGSPEAESKFGSVLSCLWLSISRSNLIHWQYAVQIPAVTMQVSMPHLSAVQQSAEMGRQHLLVSLYL